MSFIEIVLIIPLSFIAGIILNSILFRGIMLYSKNPNINALKKKQDSFRYSIVFGLIYLCLTLAFRESEINVISYLEAVSTEDFSIPVIILIALACLLLYFEKDEEKKTYLTLSLFGICIIITLFLLLIE